MWVFGETEMTYISGLSDDDAHARLDILFGFEASMVTTTICAGRVLMRDRELLTLDEAAITARSRELAQAAWGRYEQIARGEQ